MNFHLGCLLKPRCVFTRFCHATTMIVLLLSSASGAEPASASRSLKIGVSVELGADRGQSIGSLFEILDESGKVIGGAGYLGAYNTQPRSDRQQLQFFLKPDGRQQNFQVERLPVISEMCGSYPFSLQGKFYTVARGSSDARVRRWDATTNRWEPDDRIVPNAEQVANQILSVTSQSVTYADQVLLQLPASDERIGEHYYAEGNLILRQFSTTEPPSNRFVVYPWNPAKSEILSARGDCHLELRTPREFVYAFGQLRGHVLAATNTGGVYRFDGQAWSVLREPSPGVSFQIYSAINYYDQLLLGQYPTGEVFEYDGEKLAQLPGWPPVLKGVSQKARELQTLGIYGGDLYAGVWPWGEVWRYDRNQHEWVFVQRMFTHPELDETIIHPYEVETRRVDDVFNLWGQRITGLVPFENALMITTSSKGGNRWEPKFDFLATEKRSDYGAAYKLVVPGQLAVATQWKETLSQFQFEVTESTLKITQDGKELGSLPLTAAALSSFKPNSIRWGEGVFGRFAGQLVDRKTTPTLIDSKYVRADSNRPNDFPFPLRSTYIHPERHFTAKDDQIARETAIISMLDRIKQAGLNAIFPFFTGSAGQAYYASQLLPVNVYGDTDPMPFLVREARTRGLKVYPVMCVAVCGNDRPAGILLKEPDWGLRHPDGTPLGYLSPAHPAARAWLASVAREIVTQYPVDGIVYDYLRYHNRPLRLDAAAEERFKQTLPKEITAAEEAIHMQSFKEAEVTELCRALSEAIREARPDAKIAIYSWGPHVTKNHQIAQVWPVWVERGYLDLVNISGYYHRETYGDRYLKMFEQRMSDSLAINQNLKRQVPITFALGVNTSHGKVHSSADVREYLNIATRLKLDGVSFFTWNDLLPYVDDL